MSRPAFDPSDPHLPFNPSNSDIYVTDPGDPLKPLARLVLCERWETIEPPTLKPEYAAMLAEYVAGKTTASKPALPPQPAPGEAA